MILRTVTCFYGWHERWTNPRWYGLISAWPISTMAWVLLLCPVFVGPRTSGHATRTRGIAHPTDRKRQKNSASMTTLLVADLNRGTLRKWSKMNHGRITTTPANVISFCWVSTQGVPLLTLVWPHYGPTSWVSTPCSGLSASSNPETPQATRTQPNTAHTANQHAMAPPSMSCGAKKASQEASIQIYTAF